MITFIEIFPELERELIKYKAHFAIGTSDNDPLHAFFRDEFKEWQEWQSKQNFEREYIISFIYYNPNEWLFAGIYRSISCEQKTDHFEYDTKLLNVRKDLIGRLVIKFEKSFRASYLLLENHYNKFFLSEILKERIAVKSFPGFENVKIDFEYLKSIISKDEITWKTALQHVKGIYLISDKTNGKLYVGAAYGDFAFWSRWTQYCANGHGSNATLKNLISDNGIEYAKNFQFSILEIRAATTSDEEIIARENYWKEILMTREFGYNIN